MHNMNYGKANYLKTDGKIVAVREHRLEARYVQIKNIPREGLQVQIWTLADNTEQLTFSHSYNSVYRVPKVDGDTLRLERKQANTKEVTDKPDSCYLFEWHHAGAGEGGSGLRSVAYPNKFLLIDDEENVILSSNEEEFSIFQLVDDETNLVY